jgi:hypothetical protein
VQADRHTQFRKIRRVAEELECGVEWRRRAAAHRATKQPVSAGPGPWSHNTEPGSAEFGTKAGEYLARIGHGTRLITSVVPVSMPLKAPDAISRPLASRSRVPKDLSANATGQYSLAGHTDFAAVLARRMAGRRATSVKVWRASRARLAQYQPRGRQTLLPRGFRKPEQPPRTQFTQ